MGEENWTPIVLISLSRFSFDLDINGGSPHSLLEETDETHVFIVHGCMNSIYIYVNVVYMYGVHGQRRDANGHHLRWLLSTVNKTHYIYVSHHRNKAVGFLLAPKVSP